MTRLDIIWILGNLAEVANMNLEHGLSEGYLSQEQVDGYMECLKETRDHFDDYWKDNPNS